MTRRAAPIRSGAIPRTAGRFACGATLVVLALLAPPARADWLMPDPSFREAQLQLRFALRDTMEHGSDPARLDTLGLALMRLARLDEAEAVFRRVLAIEPNDATARAALGKRALFADRLGEAESLLAGVVADRPTREALADLYATRLRRGDYARAAELATEAGDPGRAPLLQALAERGAYRVAAGPATVKVPWARTYPVPLVRVKLNGQSVLMALDTGSRDLLLDEWAARRANVESFPTQTQIFWTGTRVAVRPAWVERLELGGLKIESIPAGIVRLRKWSIQVNPHSEPVAGVIGLDLLRRFTATLDYGASVLELRRDASFSAAAGARRVPFEVWGESELTVHGSIGGGRALAMVVHSGLPECGIAGPPELFEEFGIKAGLVARAARRAGGLLQGRPWTRVSVSGVTVGPAVADKLAGWAGALDPLELWRHGVRRDALLSNDFFAKRRLTFDWAARELVIEGP